MTAAEILAVEASCLHVSPEAAHMEKLLLYAVEVERWNRRLNLTGAVSVEDFIRNHIADALSLLACQPVRESVNLLDIGTGSGIPGVVLAICLPHTAVTLLEANGRKVRFLEHIIALLGMDCRILEGRAETLAHDVSLRERFAVVTARALAGMNVLVELALPFTAVGGHFVAMKGPGYAAEMQEALPAIRMLGGQEAGVSTLSVAGKERHLVDILKVAATPDRYPRRPGIPAKRPL